MRLSLQQKEQFFHEMRELVRSGKSVPESLEMIAASRSAAMRNAAITMRSRAAGGTAEEFFAAAPEIFTTLDREVVRGGESSGHVDEAMGYLSGYYASLDRTRRKLIMHTLYPVFLLHFGAVMFAVPQLFSAGMGAFVGHVIGFLAIFYVLFALAWLAFRTAVRAANVNPAVDQIFQSIPALGGTRVALVSSRFCMLMGILMKASGGILSAINRSATASGSALFQRGAGEAVTAVQGGDALGAAIARTRAFPEAIDRAFQIGETSGRLDEEMERQAGKFIEQFNARLDAISNWLPKLIFTVITLSLAWQIVAFYQGYLRSVFSILE